VTGPVDIAKVRRATRSAARIDADDVAASIMRLAERFRPEEARDLDARFVVRVAGRGAYTIRVRRGRCLVAVGEHPEPDATIDTDPRTWLALVSGRQDGISSFCRNTLEVRGDLNLALRLETLFRPGPETSRLVRTTHTNARGITLEALVAGSGTPVLLLHGLAASKVSFLPTVDGLADGFEVHALDLPGFGKSDKPLPAGRRYHPRWMADVVSAYMRANRMREAYVVGNSMGGRIGIELALRHPRRVLGVVGLGPAVAFDEWQWAGPLLRLHGQWLGIAPFPLRRSWVEGAIRDLFCDADAIPAANIAAAAQELVACVRDRRNRLAIVACARHLAGERANGRRSFWSQLERLAVPSLWIWGRDDRLSSCHYAERVSRHLPSARVEVWEATGHVPQFEVPERTNAALRDFFAEIGPVTRR
jgi:pimeloyl-ACP methyl ester carboxylesterase/putative sterol carrier protein